MITLNFKKLFFSLAFAGFLFLAANKSNAIPATGIQDRLVQEIHHISYSQRQVELYIAIVDGISGKSKVRVANATNWSEMLRDFQIDMIIEQEALRIGGFEPTRKMLDQGYELVEQKIALSPELKQVLSNLEADKPSIINILAEALRVESFKRSKQRQAAITDERRDSSIHISTRFSTWQRELEQRALVRLYDDAMTFVALTPMSNPN